MDRNALFLLVAALMAACASIPDPVVDSGDNGRPEFELDQRSCEDWGYAVADAVLERPFEVLGREFASLGASVGVSIGGHASPQAAEIAGDINRYISREIPFQNWARTLRGWCLEECGYHVDNRAELHLSPPEDFCTRLARFAGMTDAMYTHCVEAATARESRLKGKVGSCPIKSKPYNGAL